MIYWDEKSLEYKYRVTQVFEQQVEDLEDVKRSINKQINKLNKDKDNDLER